MKKFECGEMSTGEAVTQFMKALSELGRAILCAIGLHDWEYFRRKNGWGANVKICLYCWRKKPIC